MQTEEINRGPNFVPFDMGYLRADSGLDEISHSSPNIQDDESTLQRLMYADPQLFEQAEAHLSILFEERFHEVKLPKQNLEPNQLFTVMGEIALRRMGGTEYWLFDISQASDNEISASKALNIMEKRIGQVAGFHFIFTTLNHEKDNKEVSERAAALINELKNKAQTDRPDVAVCVAVIEPNEVSPVPAEVVSTDPAQELVAV